MIGALPRHLKIAEADTVTSTGNTGSKTPNGRLAAAVLNVQLLFERIVAETFMRALPAADAELARRTRRVARKVKALIVVIRGFFMTSVVMVKSRRGGNPPPPSSTGKKSYGVMLRVTTSE